MSFTYFAYGSNLWPQQMRSRCRSARALSTAVLEGWVAVYDKPSIDRSSKLNIRPARESQVRGALYEIDDDERAPLDAAEPDYDPVEVMVATSAGRRVEALTYRWSGEPHSRLPYDWYVALVEAGARHHHLPEAYVAQHLTVAVDPDPIVSDMRPATPPDLPAMQRILSAALASDGDRFTIHPGDLAWWIHHADPRHHDLLTYWLAGESGFLVIDDRKSEISVFAEPGEPVVPLIEWAQRRFAGRGEVGFVSDDDTELVSYLQSNDYEVTWTDHSYRWDLQEKTVPDPDIGAGWVLRHVSGEVEADNRRQASHASFQSTMDPAMHLDRYLEFMRSSVYDLERDLVAVAPDGRIASFMVWWPDESGIAQIEPFGTHPDFQRQGVGRALIHHGLSQMKEAGMRACRVVTDNVRPDAIGFYEAVGFSDVGRLRWWRKPD